jgi:hypothetical protein
MLTPKVLDSAPPARSHRKLLQQNVMHNSNDERRRYNKPRMGSSTRLLGFREIKKVNYFCLKNFLDFCMPQESSLARRTDIFLTCQPP